MSKYNIHDDFKKYEKTKSPLYPLILPLLDKMMVKMFDRVPLIEGIKETKRRITGYQGGNIALHIFEPENGSKHMPCLIYFHGGAFVLRAAPHHKKLLCMYALKTPCKVIFVDYRLAPKYPFPVGVEDCYSAYRWICDNTGLLGIDETKIAIGGDSAGGALAAGVCLMARDRNEQKMRFQMLIYPVTDERQSTESMKNYIDTPMWNAKLNGKMWRLYLKNGANAHKEYASPMEANAHKELPPAYIEVAEFDCLRDEGIAYAEALTKSGVSVEFFETHQTVHGFEIAIDSELVKQSLNKRIGALQKAFEI